MTPRLEEIHYMQLALVEAKKASKAGEVPVGALLRCGEQIIATGHNLVEKKQDATAHAELSVLQRSCQLKKAKYLPDCTLYITLEPCPMCAMACYWTQIGRVVFGASDPKRGYQRFSHNLLHPKTEILSGVCTQESKELLKGFFENLRTK